MKLSPSKSRFSVWMVLLLTAIGFALCTLVTRSPVEPLVGLLIFWGTLLIPALVQRVWQWLQTRQT